MPRVHFPLKRRKKAPTPTTDTNHIQNQTLRSNNSNNKAFEFPSPGNTPQARRFANPALLKRQKEGADAVERYFRRKEEAKKEKARVGKARSKPSRSSVLRTIRYLQKTTHLLIPKRRFSRIVRHMTAKSHSTRFRFAATAMEALQEATEAYAIGLFEDAYFCTLHAKRATLRVHDMRLAQKLR